MKWKKLPSEFLSEKTFLVLKEDLNILKGTRKKNAEKNASHNATNIGTWPPKMKRVQIFCGEIERPKTANLEKPSVLDPKLVDKLDMSLLSKELLCDSVSRFHQTKLVISGSTSSSLISSPKQRQNAVVDAGGQRHDTTFSRSSSQEVPVKRKRRKNELTYELRQMEIDPRSPINQKSLHVVSSHEHGPADRNSNVRKLDDNNNRNSSTKVLSTVKKKSSKAAMPSDLKIFMRASANSAPEPCKTCGRPDQPERFHSHPKGYHTKINEITPTTKPKTISMPKSIQRPIALNFRSDKKNNKSEEDNVVCETKSKSISPQEGSTTLSSAPIKRGRRIVTCYICARDFGTASFPIHEPKCMEKWERENNSLPSSQRRLRPQRPTIEIEHSDWNAAAWRQSQEQLIPCAKCGRTFLPERLPVHERSCKTIPKNNELRLERLSKQSPANARNGPPLVPCQVCGRKFGSRSIKIHEPQCNRRRQMEKESANLNKDQSMIYKQKSSNRETSSATYLATELPQKKTITCYICGRDFGSSSIAIHEPQCLKKWHAENDQLSPARRRKVPQKPEVIYTEDPQTGNPTIDVAATAEANWTMHLSQLVPCKHCGRTFNPDRVNIHERSCKGNR